MLMVEKASIACHPAVGVQLADEYPWGSCRLHILSKKAITE